MNALSLLSSCNIIPCVIPLYIYFKIVFYTLNDLKSWDVVCYDTMTVSPEDIYGTTHKTTLMGTGNDFFPFLYNSDSCWFWTDVLLFVLYVPVVCMEKGDMSINRVLLTFIKETSIWDSLGRRTWEMGHDMSRQCLKPGEKTPGTQNLNIGQVVVCWWLRRESDKEHNSLWRRTEFYHCINDQTKTNKYLTIKQTTSVAYPHCNGYTKCLPPFHWLDWLQCNRLGGQCNAILV